MFLKIFCHCSPVYFFPRQISQVPLFPKTPGRASFFENTVTKCNFGRNDISTAREQKGLGTIGARHDGYQVVYKVLVHHVVSHSRPASVRVTLISLNE